MKIWRDYGLFEPTHQSRIAYNGKEIVINGIRHELQEYKNYYKEESNLLLFSILSYLLSPSLSPRI